MSDVTIAPRDRDQALSCAYLRHLGASQEEASKATGISARTLSRWESCSWWRDVQREAADRWLAGLAARARRGLERAVEEDGRLALSVLERLDVALAPPKPRDAVEAKEPSYTLLKQPFWRYVIALMMHDGISIEEAQSQARNSPQEVEAWAREKGLIGQHEPLRLPSPTRTDWRALILQVPHREPSP